MIYIFLNIIGRTLAPPKDTARGTEAVAEHVGLSKKFRLSNSSGTDFRFSQNNERRNKDSY